MSTDVDCDAHDYTADGVLPEALTTLFSVKTGPQKEAQLASDWGEIDKEVGLANIRCRYPKRLTFLHKVDSQGDRATTYAMVLLPVDEAEGVNLSTLKESTMMTSGTYTEVPVATSFTKISKKLAMAAKRAMQDDWKYEGADTVDTSQRFAASKIARGQVGSGLHEMWLKDIISTCGKKCLYINNLIHGSGEIGDATISAKISVEATGNNVRVCLFSHDPRVVFQELGRARCLTKIGKLYLEKKLVLPGHVPVESPGERPEKTKKMLKALLPSQLKVLSMNSLGLLILPNDEELSQACPHPLPEEFTQELGQWRAEFPRPQQEETASTPRVEDADPANGGGAPADGGTQKNLAGTVKVNEEAIEKDLKEKIVKKTDLPATGAKSMALEYGLAHNESAGYYRVWIHNRSTRDVSTGVGFYLGAGGPGTFLSLARDTPTEAQKLHMYRWTRYTSCKQDKAEMGNAYMILNKDGVVPADGGKPKLCNFEELEQEFGTGIQLYGHAITRGGRGKTTLTPAPTPVAWTPTLGEEQTIAKLSCKTLGQFTHSMEDASGSVPKLMGYLRPVFEVIPKATDSGVPKAKAKAAPPGPSAYNTVIRPNAGSGQDSVHLFSSKKIEIPAGAWFALH